MDPCPCGTGRAYADCCLPYHAGTGSPPTAVALMRARYSAFVKHRVDYITRTLHPARTSGYDEKEIRDWSQRSEWKGLEILAVEGGEPADERGSVEFIARYRAKDDDVEHHEVAEFRKRDGEWFFHDGRIKGSEPIHRDAAKVGRNDPCSCGSGKKFKKCCGA